MKKTILAIALAVAFTACQTKTTSETVVDTLVVAVDTAAVDTAAVALPIGGGAGQSPVGEVPKQNKQ